MKDKNDNKTIDFIGAKRRVGRPPKDGLRAMTDAERAKAYRQRKKARLAEIRDVTKPISSKVLDLSVLRAWERK